MRKQYIILALVANRNFMCCTAVKCKTANDINPPSCNLEDLTDQVLIDICDDAGLPMEPDLNRNGIVRTAEICYQATYENEDDLKDLSDKELKDICKNVGYDGLSSKPNPTRRELVLAAKLCRQIGSEASKNAALTGTTVSDILSDMYKYVNDDQNDYSYNNRRCENVDDINPPTCNIEDLKDDVLIDLCRDIGYHHKPNPTRERIVKCAQLCIISKRNLDQLDAIGTDTEEFARAREKARQSVLSTIENTIQNEERIPLLHYDYVDLMIEDPSFAIRSKRDRINYVMSKHGIVDARERDLTRILLKSALKTNEERIPLLHNDYIDLMIEDSSFASRSMYDRISYLLSKHGIVDDIEKDHTRFLLRSALEDLYVGRDDKELSGYVPTPEDIAMLPEWKSYKLPGIGEGMKFFQKDGKAVISEWNDNSKRWSTPEEFDEFNYENGIFIKWMRMSIKYEHVLPSSVENRDGSEQTLVIGYNYGDDPLATAQRVLAEYEVDEVFLESITDLVRESEEIIKQALDTRAENRVKIGALGLEVSLTWLSLSVGIGLVLILAFHLEPKKRKKKARKPPQVSPLSCHQPKMKKTIYVKLFASKNLNGKQGRRLNGIVAKSGVQYIELEKRTGQPTVMYKIEASNGVVYIPVHIKGSEEAIEKAIASIKEAVGKENMDEEIELPPTKPQQAKSTSPKPKSTTTSKVSSALPKILKKKKSTGRSLSSTIWSSICITCQSLRTITFNTCQISSNYICSMAHSIGHYRYYLQWPFGLFIHFHPGMIFDSKWKDYALVLGSYTLVFIIHHVLRPDFIFVSVLILVVIPGCIISYHKMLLSCCYYVQQKAAQIARLYSQPNIIPNYTLFTSDTDQSKTEDVYWITLFLALAILGWFCALSYEYVSQRSKRPPSLIYVKSTKAKELKVQQNKKMKEIVKKSGLDKVLIEPTAVGDNYTPIQMIGSRRSVWKAIELIQEAVGTEHVSTTKPSNTVSVQESAVSSTVNASVSEPQPIQEESPTTPESPVQPETTNDDGNNLAKEAFTTKSPPTTLQVKEEEEEVPSEIGIDSCQGMTRETITEASISSLNDRSNISKAYSNFTTLNEDDPLLIFLRSQASCIKGSVDEFYTWLVKSEDIDSMMALKEAVNEDDYLNDMKVGDGGGSGIKGFKRKAFLRAISEYFNDESDTKSTVEEPQSLPQCQMKNLSETLEPPEELVCPISLHLMTNDPVVAADGITYERASIEDWFEKSKAKISETEENLKQNPHSEADQRVVNNGICSPVYGSKLESLALMPITGTRNMARAFKEKTETSCS